MTEGDIYRGTTSCSPQPRGLRPRRVLTYPAAVTGGPDTSLLMHVHVQVVSSGMYSQAVSSTLFTNQGFSLQAISRLLRPFSALAVSNSQRRQLYL